MKLRESARELFLETLRHLNIEEAMASRVSTNGTILSIGPNKYDLSQFSSVSILSMGKAAVPMCEAMLRVLKPVLLDRHRLQGVAVGSVPFSVPRPEIQYFKGNHPLPGVTSQRAAEAILRLLAQSGPDTLVLFLISGGASAMVEMALAPNVSLEEVARFHKALVHSGLPISQMNVLRKHFSRVKGGRLAVAAAPATQCTLLISDVPNDMPHAVSSGPSLPDPSTVSECRQILRISGDKLHLSDRLLDFFFSASLEETPKADHPAFHKAAWVSLLSSDDLCNVAGKLAQAKGFEVFVDNRCDDWDYRDAARYLIDQLKSLRRQHGRVCLLSAGELSVPLTRRHGIGGRNQQFVLECARHLVEGDLCAAVLSGGSDGIDGNSVAAGAICDQDTIPRAIKLGKNIPGALEQFDTFPLLDSLGDTIITGPTGNNVRDLRILLAEE